MPAASISAFTHWWASLKTVQLPRPGASAMEERRHQFYYAFAAELRTQWQRHRSAFEKVLRADKKRVGGIVSGAASDMIGWLNTTGWPTLNKVLHTLRTSKDERLPLLAASEGAFCRGAFRWLTRIETELSTATQRPLLNPPYLSLGAQIGRPEVPLRESTGVWARDVLVQNWPWRNLPLINERVRELGLPTGGDDAYERSAQAIAEVETYWLDALRKVPTTSVQAQHEAAASPWIHAKILTLLLGDHVDGRLSMPAVDWPRQVYAPYRAWFFGLGGDSNGRRDSNGIETVEPINRLNTPFSPPNPDVSYFASSHVRGYCLFVRYLAEAVIDACKNIPAEQSSDKAESPRLPTKRVRAQRHADCMITVGWSQDGTYVVLGSRISPDQHRAFGLPVSVLRVLKGCGYPIEEDSPSEKGDPHRFNKWFREHFDVHASGNAVKRHRGVLVPAWCIPGPA